MEEEDEGPSRVYQVEHFPSEEDHPSSDTQSHSKGEDEEGDKFQGEKQQVSGNAHFEIDELKKQVYDEENSQEKNEQSPSLSVQPQIDDSGSGLIAGDESDVVGGEEASLPAIDESPTEPQLQINMGEAPSMSNEAAPNAAPLLDDAPSLVSYVDAPPIDTEEAPSSILAEDPSIAPSVDTEEASTIVAKDSPSIVTKDTYLVVSKDASPTFAQGAPSIVSEGGSVMVTTDTPSMVADAAPSMASKDTPKMVVEEKPSVVEKDTPSMVEKDSPSMVTEDTPSMVTEDTPSMVAEGAYSTTNDTPRMVVEDQPPMAEKEAPSVVAEETPSVVAEDPPSMIAEIAPSIVKNTLSIVAEGPPSVIAEIAPSMVAEAVSAIAAESTLSMVMEDAPPIVVEEAPTVAGEDSAKAVAEEAPRVAAEDGSADTSPMDDENASARAAGEVAQVSEVDTEVEMETETEMFDTEMTMETEAVEGGGSPIKKRKRGRPAKSQSAKAQTAKAQPKGTPPPRRVEEEDVCFICFDGGNLVLCDRRGCPKAYHPACVNRDEAFFRSKGRWNCGWHLCSICEKAAHYMCYTCTYSVCKGCIKDAEYLCVRGNRGFCEACMKTILLIEKNEQAQIDFNDRSSWEYLFKEYWVDLKGKESLTLDELTQAKNPLKGSNTLTRKGESSEELYDANDEKGSDSDGSSEHLEVSSSKKSKARGRPKTSKFEEPPSVRHAVGEVRPLSNDAEWASKELLEFVAHMKNGDKSVVSQFDVQALLLDYIKQNNLRDPRRKSQIICDSRLESLFGKPRVGHFEMLKLLELHFLIKEDTRADDIQRTTDAEENQLDGDGSTGLATKAISDKRRKSRKSGRGPQTNLDDYAAIDVHNIKLLYLRRNLMEDLLEDSDKFHDKVVGAFVRIRISGAGQKQDMYRLVQIAGTQKVAEPYKIAKRLADVVLEIQNLNKTEFIPIDTISNQDFSEDECKRLRQSIKCGLISRMSVGEVQEKAMSLQAVRVSDWLETEKLRISHLRDRASEQGRRKDLRECVEKLQLLNTPEERLRRLQEIPEVHADPNMDPNYESEEDEEQDDRPQDKSTMSRDAGYGSKGRELISPAKVSPNDTWSGARKGPSATTSSEPNRNLSTPSTWDRSYGGNSAGELVNDTHHHSNNWEKPKDLATSGIGISSPSPANPPEPTPATSLPNVNETDKIWHYQDPSGKIQGPFSMQQLRKWNKTGHFPVDLRIWRTTEKQEDSILLNDALAGKFHKEPPPKVNHHHGGSTTPVSGFPNGAAQLANSDPRVSSSGWAAAAPMVEPKRNDVWGSGSSNWAAPTGSGSNWAAPATEQFGHGQSFRGGWDSRGGNNGWGGRPSPQTPYYGQPQRPISPHPRGGQSGGGRWNRGHNWNSSRGRGGSDKRPNHVGPTGPSSWRTPENNPKGWGSGVQIPNPSPNPNPNPNPSNRSELSNLPSPTPMSSSRAWSPVGVAETNKIGSGWGEQQNLPVTPTPAPTGGWVQQQNLPVTPTPTGGWVQQQNLPITPTPTGGWVQQQNFPVIPTQSGGWVQQSNKPGEVLNQDYSNPPTPTPMSAGN